MSEPAATDKEIGERLREARERAGLSQKQTATLLGVEQARISRLETGDYKCTPQELIAFSETYAVGYEWILGEWTENDLPEHLVAMCEKLPPIDRRKLLRTLASFGNMY